MDILWPAAWGRLIYCLSLLRHFLNCNSSFKNSPCSWSSWSIKKLGSAVSPLSLWCGSFRVRRRAGRSQGYWLLIQVLCPCMGGAVHLRPWQMEVGGWGTPCSVRPAKGITVNPECKFPNSCVYFKSFLKSQVYEPQFIVLSLLVIWCSIS